MVGPSELIIILIIGLLLFGGKKLPEIARSLGEAVKEFRRASSEIHYAASTATRGHELDDARSRVAEDVLLETARKLGINPEGKSLTEISDEIVKAHQRKSTE